MSNQLHSFIFSFIHSCQTSLIHSFIHSFIHTKPASFILSFIHSCQTSFIHSFIHSCQTSFSPSFIHSCQTSKQLEDIISARIRNIQMYTYHTYIWILYALIYSDRFTCWTLDYNIYCLFQVFHKHLHVAITTSNPAVDKLVGPYLMLPLSDPTNSYIQWSL